MAASLFSYAFTDSPVYKERASKPYTVPKATLKQIHDAVPKHLHERKTWTSLYYVARAYVMAGLFYKYGTYIPALVDLAEPLGPRVQWWTKLVLWVNYWWWQSLVGCSFWTLAHEAGHSTLSPYQAVNHAIGFPLHCFVLVPYYGWRYSHNMHHKSTASIERDENFCPSTRSDYKLPPAAETTPSIYKEVLDEAPIFSLARLLLQQTLGLHAYLIVNALGNSSYPAGTNHYTPNSPLFRRDASKLSIIACNIGILAMTSALAYYAHVTSWAQLARMYIIPWFMTNHWIVALVYLQHTDPTLPHFRKGAWTFLRGATATIDRPLLGWMGRFFLHNISHDHVAHHFFSMIPFYSAPEVTKHIIKVLGDDYCYDETGTFRAIYRNFRACSFIEDEGDIIFYKDRSGKAARHLGGDVSPTFSPKTEEKEIVL